MAGEKRRNHARKGDSDYEIPWLFKEFYGAPIWAILGLGVVVIGLGAAYLMQR
ncbi:hypothetical protein [Microbacterium azadirachtae]|uniref:Uncharacterized protein n=1 Tax=Microbacterium azadirachtae TaxID=582680 RepID=A0A0F0LFG5_9MICO|nr:hypothetical protein [Microbacterium azadirachtae]KJL31873.1 hypothetical protein RS86_03154 [Microbacterium azadirachtae]